MPTILILGLNEETGQSRQTWLDRTDVESIISRSTKVKRTRRGPMQDQYETLTHVKDAHGYTLDEGPLTIVAGHYSDAWNMLEAARKPRRSR